MALPVGPVVYSINVNGQQVNEFPLDVELRQEWGCHDLFIVRIEIPRTSMSLSQDNFWPNNAPVSIVWGRRPDSINTWYGYVNHHNIKGNADSGTKATQVTYVLIGTSKPMNTDRTKTWGQSTGTYIAKTIFGSYGLRSILTTTNWLLPYEVQANESDFAFLNRIADKIGFRVWISGSTGYFVDPAVVLSGSSTQGVPNFYSNKLFTQVDTMRDFEMNQGDNLPGAVVSDRNLFGIDAQSGNVFQAQAVSAQNPTITQIYSDWPVTDYTTAKNLVQAKQNRSQFWITATAELFGDTYLYPGKMVFLSGNQVPPDAQGYWLIGSAKHLLKASGTTVSSYDKYVTQVVLMRNNNTIIPNFNTNQGSNVVPEYVPCVFRNGSWVSTKATILYDGTQV